MIVTNNNFLGSRVLVVEDEYFLASDMKRALIKEGSEVIGPVGSAHAALELLKMQIPDAAILDINLGTSQGYEIADALDKLSVPYLFVSGYDIWSIPERYRDVPRLAKPLEQVRIVEALKALLWQT